MKKGFVLFVVLLLVGCSSGIEKQETEKQQTGGGEAMVKVLMVVAPENFRDEEFLEPKKVFENNGITIEVASKGVSVAKGTYGAETAVDKNISEVNVKEYAAVVFIGGGGAATYLDDATAFGIAKAAYDSQKVVAAICIAPSILANAGLLEGRKATAFSSEKDNLESKGATYTGEAVTVDRRIVTANGPAAAKLFGEEIVKLLG